MPGSAPSTPASHDPSVLVSCPASKFLTSSPKYQTLPRVLRVPVVGVLHDLAIDGDRVAHDGHGDPHHGAGLVGDDDFGALQSPSAVALVHPPRPGGERQIRVVDGGDEVGRIDRRVVGAAVGSHDDGGRRPAERWSPAERSSSPARPSRGRARGVVLFVDRSRGRGDGEGRRRRGGAGRVSWPGAWAVRPVGRLNAGRRSAAVQVRSWMLPPEGFIG